MQGVRGRKREDGCFSEQDHSERVKKKGMKKGLGYKQAFCLYNTFSWPKVTSYVKGLSPVTTQDTVQKAFKCTPIHAKICSKPFACVWWFLFQMF